MMSSFDSLVAIYVGLACELYKPNTIYVGLACELYKPNTMIKQSI